MGKSVNGHDVIITDDDRLKCENCGHIGERPSRYRMTECDPQMSDSEWLNGPVTRCSDTDGWDGFGRAYI